MDSEQTVRAIKDIQLAAYHKGAADSLDSLRKAFLAMQPHCAPTWNAVIGLIEAARKEIP